MSAQSSRRSSCVKLAFRYEDGHRGAVHWCAVVGLEVLASKYYNDGLPTMLSDPTYSATSELSR